MTGDFGRLWKDVAVMLSFKPLDVGDLRLALLDYLRCLYCPVPTILSVEAANYWSE